MFVPIQCSFCDKTFDFDISSGILLVDCPHCGKQNTVAAPSDNASELTVLHDAPTLNAGKACPSCKTQVDRSAVLCVQCGYNFNTGEKAAGRNWFADNKFIAISLLGGVISSAIILTFVFWPKPKAPQPFLPADEPIAQPAVVETLEVESPPPAVEVNIPAPADEPVPPPGPTAEEIAAQQANADRAAFETKKRQAESRLRQQLDTREPLYKLNDPVELRRKNGVFYKGTLQGFSGEGPDRVAVVATPVGEVGIPLIKLDNPSRRLVDADYREGFIQHLLSTKLPADPGE